MSVLRISQSREIALYNGDRFKPNCDGYYSQYKEKTCNCKVFISRYDFSIMFSKIYAYSEMDPAVVKYVQQLYATF